jgi:hypothetical protein
MPQVVNAPFVRRYLQRLLWVVLCSLQELGAPSAV